MATANVLVTDWFKKNYYYLWPTTSTEVKVSVQMYGRIPTITQGSTDAFASMITISDLSDWHPEWVKCTSSAVAKTSATVEDDLYLIRIISADHPALTANSEFLQLGRNDGSWSSVCVENDGGFYLETGVGGVQEIVAATVFYLDDPSFTDTDGNTVTNPILFATTSGIGDYAVARDGTVYGQSSSGLVSGDDAYVIELDLTGYGSTIPITEVSRESNVATITVAVGHGITVGNLIKVTSVGSGFDNVAIATGVTATSISYPNSGTDVATISSYGTVELKSSKFFFGRTILNLPPPEWEPAHSHHIWLEPQRTNFIANPSFESTKESGDLNYWRLGSTDTGDSPVLEQGERGVDILRPYCGHAARGVGDTGNLVLESNLFPKVGRWASVSFEVSGEGILRYGLVAYPNDYTNPVYVRSGDIILTGGNETSGYQTFGADKIIDIPDDIIEVALRIEFDGDEFWVDNVLVDQREGQSTYFDGNSTESLTDDFRWVGGSTYANQHFSVWYNNFKNTSSRLVGAVEDGVYKEGLLDDWAPNGATIKAHWNAVTRITPYNWSGDAFYPISDFTYYGADCVAEPIRELSFTLQLLT